MRCIGGRLPCALRRNLTDRLAAIVIATMAVLCCPNAAGARELAGRIAFDLAPQPLETALQAYAAASGTQTLYEMALVSGRRSAGLRGIFTPGTALSVLLAGTGLIGRRTDIDAFTISPVPMESGAIAPAIIPDRHFLGAVQAGILGALCRGAQTLPGNYKIAVQLWIAPSGVIEGTALLGSSGEFARDAMLLEALRDVVIEARPPAGMSQPVTMAVLPRAPRETGDCSRR